MVLHHTAVSNIPSMFSINSHLTNGFASYLCVIDCVPVINITNQITGTHTVFAIVNLSSFITTLPIMFTYICCHVCILLFYCICVFISYHYLTIYIYVTVQLSAASTSITFLFLRHFLHASVYCQLIC